MLWEKSQIHTNEHYKKLSAGFDLVKGEPGEDMVSECQARKDREDRAYWQHIVKMGYYIISVVQWNIQGSIGKNNPGEASHRKQKDKTQNPQDGRCTKDRRAMEWCKSWEDFNPSWYCNDYGGGGKIGSGIYIHSYCEYMMRSYDKT